MVGSNPLHPLEVDASIIGFCMAACMLVALRFFKWE
jgi:hypothetical protein